MPRRNSSSSSSSSSSGSNSSSSSSSSNEEEERRKKRRKKKTPLRRNATPVSPSVSHPKNKKAQKKNTKATRKQKHKQTPSSDSASGAKVLPLSLKNVVNHTETVKHAVDKGDTVNTFLNTIGAVNGEYALATEPEIIAIPTPLPDKPNARKKKKQKENHRKTKAKVESSTDDSDNDTEMYTETTSKHGKETSLLRSKIQSRENQGLKDEGGEAEYPPLNAEALQKKFETLANIGAKTLKEGNSKAYDEQFAKWRKENGENPDLDTPPPNSRPPEKLVVVPPKPALTTYRPLASHSLRDSGFNTAETSQNSKRTSSVQVKLDNPQPTRPLKVTKSTSGAQTEEYPAFPSSVPFDVPSVLMLDSYTQTNEADRLSTKLIVVRKSISHAQTDSSDLNPTVKPNFPLSKKVSFSIQTENAAHNSTKRRTIHSPKEPEVNRQDIDTPLTFELKRTCRHGNDRKRCEECNNSVVRKKPRSFLLEKSSTTVSSNVNTSEHANLMSRSQPYSKDEDKDSGQESDPNPSPHVSNTDLAKIRHLARAKLKQIKKSEHRLVHRSLERLKFTPKIVEEEDEREIPHQQAAQSPKKRKPKIRNGIASLTLQDLPVLADTGGDLSDEDSSDGDGHGSAKQVVRRVNEYHEKKRLADVTRAKNFIKHCIDTPLADGNTYKHVARRKDSLPLIHDKRRCDSEATNKRTRGIADDVESRKCVSEVPSGKMRSFDVNYKAYINALERIADSNLSALTHAEKYQRKF